MMVMDIPKYVQFWQIAEQASKTDLALLSDFSAPFMVKYTADHTTYDRLFLNMYRTFWYYSYAQDTILERTNAFILDVKSLLTVNSKKYTELFRLENLDDAVYNILDNYDMTETMERLTGNKRIEQLGERNDSTSYGEMNNTVTTNNPEITITRKNDVSAFDDDSYSPREQTTETTNNHSIDTIGQTEAHTDTNKQGAQENNISDNGTENYNLRRKGNIGVMTQSDVLMKHLELWDAYRFYQKIFADIADTLLYAEI